MKKLFRILDNTKQAKLLTKQELYQLESRFGLDAHEFKQQILGKKTGLSKYDIYKDNKTQELIIRRKSEYDDGTEQGIRTEYFLY